jgi:TetR/AcrR family transcriptional regulator, transcriptional repressor for nem operon
MDAYERLIASTCELLWDQGFDATSPRDIQAHAGVGQGSMYHHFTGKTGLAVVALQRTSESMKADVSDLLEGSLPPLDRLRAYLLRERHILRGCPIGRMAQDTSVISTPELLAPIQETLSWLVLSITCVLTEAQDRGELSGSLNPADLATTIAATLQGAYVLSRAQHSTDPFDAAVRGILGLLSLAATTTRTPQAIPAAPTPTRKRK